MKDIKDYVSDFHQYGIYLPTKSIVITGEVDDDMLDKHLKNIHILDSYEGSIDILLSTIGGDVTVAKALYDAISTCKNLVRITCYGLVASSGTIILQAADERVITSSCKLMLHVGEDGAPSNHPENTRALIANHDDDGNWMLEIYLSKINQKRILDKKKKMSLHELKKMLQYDKYLKPKEALTLGIIDRIED